MELDTNAGLRHHAHGDLSLSVMTEHEEDNLKRLAGLQSELLDLIVNTGADHGNGEQSVAHDS